MMMRREQLLGTTCRRERRHEDEKAVKREMDETNCVRCAMCDAVRVPDLLVMIGIQMGESSALAGR